MRLFLHRVCSVKLDVAARSIESVLATMGYVIQTEVVDEEDMAVYGRPVSCLCCFVGTWLTRWGLRSLYLSACNEGRGAVWREKGGVVGSSNFRGETLTLSRVSPIPPSPFWPPSSCKKTSELVRVIAAAAAAVVELVMGRDAEAAAGQSINLAHKVVELLTSSGRLPTSMVAAGVCVGGIGWLGNW